MISTTYHISSSLLGRMSPAKPGLPPQQDRGAKPPAQGASLPAVSESTVSLPPVDEGSNERTAMLERTVEELRGRVDQQYLKIFALERALETQNIAARSRNLVAFGIAEDLDEEAILEASSLLGETVLDSLPVY